MPTTLQLELVLASLARLLLYDSLRSIQHKTKYPTPLLQTTYLNRPRHTARLLQTPLELAARAVRQICRVQKLLDFMYSPAPKMKKTTGPKSLAAFNDG